MTLATDEPTTDPEAGCRVEFIEDDGTLMTGCTFVPRHLLNAAEAERDRLLGTLDRLLKEHDHEWAAQPCGCERCMALRAVLARGEGQHG